MQHGKPVNWLWASCIGVLGVGNDMQHLAALAITS